MVTQQSWSRDQVRRVLSVTERHLRCWEQQGLIPPQERYGLSDLIALRALNSLREKKVPVARVRRSFQSLRERLQHIANPFTELKVFLDGKRIGVHLGGQKMDSLSGQLLLDFDAAALEKLRPFSRPEGRKIKDRQKTLAEADEWFQRGLEVEQTGGPIEHAILAYEKAIALNPQAAGAHVNLGTIRFHQRRWAQAEEHYGKAIAADPEYALAQFNLANLYDERGDRLRALTHYHAALRLNPHYADVYYNLALLHQASGDVLQAVQYWSTYLKLDPHSQWAIVARRELAKLKQATVIPGARSLSQHA
ncbi:MAG: tetratricopeptide repeat protein [Acidobacteriota bacterium]